MARVHVSDATAKKVDVLLGLGLDEVIKGMKGKTPCVELRNALIGLKHAVTMVQTLGEQARTDLMAMKLVAQDQDDLRGMLSASENFSGVIGVTKKVLTGKKIK